jgi:2'-5' RNA ligase
MTWYKIAKKEEKVKDEDLQDYQSFGWTSIAVPDSVIEKVKHIQKNIDKEDLFIKHEGDWSYGLEDDFHITVKWGIVTKDPEKVKEAVKGHKGGEVKLKDVDLFENDEYDVLKVNVESDALRELNKAISDSLETEDSHPDYNPHVTIAYIKTGKGKNYIGLSDFKDMKFSFDEIVDS